MTLAAETLTQVLAELKEKLRPEQISVQITDRLACARGTCPYEFKWLEQGPYPCLPDLVVWPESTADVAAVVKAAVRHRVPVIPYGGGSGIVGGTVPEHGGIVLDLKRLTSLSVNDTNLTVTAGAGYNGQHLEDELNRRGYTLGHFPQSIHSATVGGWVAPMAIGTFSTKYGKIDDMLVGLEVVLPTGEVLRTPEAPKESTGPDLKHLFLGSEGAFGVITQATFRIWPRPEAREWEGYTFPTTGAGLTAVRKILRTGLYPALVRLYDPDEAAARIAALGYEQGYALLILAFEGRRDLVALERRVADELCRAEGGLPKGPEPGRHWFASRLSTQHLVETNYLPGGAADAIEVSAPWDKLEGVWRAMRRALEPLAQEVHCHFSHFYHTGGSVYVLFYARTGGDARQGEEHYRRCVRAAVEASLAAGGTISHHHGVGRVKAPWMPAEHGVGFEVMRKIKAALDPADIMNPGVLGLGGKAPC